MGWMDFILAAATTIMGGGWIFTYRAYKRKNDGEAAQAEADGWKSQQDVYQQTIEDLKASCAYIKEDRNLLREENKQLLGENKQLREKYNDLERQILDMKSEYQIQMCELRKEIAKQGRKIEGLLPFTCGLAGCPNRSRVEIVEKLPTELKN